MTKPAPTKQDGEKQFSLKQIEENVISNINQRHNAEMLDFLTFISMERLAYNVTETTQFRVEDHVLYIKENVVEPEAAEEKVAVA